MKFLIVDDEPLSLRRMDRMLTKLYPQVEILTADNAIEALELADSEVLVAFLDIEMPGVSGVQLAEELQEKCGLLNIIFTTAYNSYMIEAYRLRASGYLLKPVTEAAIQKEMKDLRFRINL